MKIFILSFALLTMTSVLGQEQNNVTLNSKKQSQIVIYPTQSLSGTFKIIGLDDKHVLRAEVHELSGKKVSEIDYSKSGITEGATLQLNVDSGTYIASIVTDQGTVMRRIFVGRNYIN